MPTSATFFVYVLRSRGDGDRYIGMTTDVIKRVPQHNAGKVKSTKSRVPFDLVYQECFDNRSSARVREKYFKTAAGRRWLDAHGY